MVFTHTHERNSRYSWAPGTEVQVNLFWPSIPVYFDLFWSCQQAIKRWLWPNGWFLGHRKGCKAELDWKSGYDTGYTCRRSGWWRHGTQSRKERSLTHWPGVVYRHDQTRPNGRASPAKQQSFLLPTSAKMLWDLKKSWTVSALYKQFHWNHQLRWISTF